MTYVPAHVGARCLALLVLIAGLNGALSSSSFQSHAAPAVALDVDWPHFGNTTDQTRYSLLTQINPRTVRQLGVAWTFSQDSRMTGWETDPVVVHGIMYLTTSTSQVVALNAATGKELWRFTPAVDFIQLMRGGSSVPVSRGLEVAGGRVYLLAYDTQLFSLDATSGHVVWHTRVTPAGSGYSESSPPTYWHGMLFVGSSEGDAGLRGFVAAYRASDGHQLWRFSTVPAPGHDWMPARGNHGGGAVWMPPTIDARTGILYIGTGNPSPDLLSSARPGCNQWTDATVALQAATGKFLWGYTEVCPDSWDYDSDQTPILFTVTKQGREIRAVGAGNKSGFYWIFDARTGKVLAKSPALAKQSAPRRVPTAKGVLVCPGKLGGLGYSPPAYSPATGTIFVAGIDLCMVYKSESATASAQHQSGRPDVGGSAEPAGQQATGFMAALDAATGKIQWKRRMPKPMIGGVLATATGLVFSGSDDGRLYCFDAGTGLVLWHADAGLGFGAAPMTYAVDGIQYLAVAAGGSAATPYTGARPGGTLLVMKLGGTAIRRLPVAH